MDRDVDRDDQHGWPTGRDIIAGWLYALGLFLVMVFI